jgi:hypothetical protein
MIDVLMAAATIALSHPHDAVDVYAYEVGDDNNDGVVMEDESGWSCVDDGNRTCGPGNPQGVPAGRYDEGGVLVDPWPVDEYAYDSGAFVGGYNERAMKTAVNQKLGGRKTITAGYRYVPWSGPTAGWHQMMSKTDMTQKTHNGFVR